MERIFGTDGIRGRYGEGWLTTGKVSALGRAVGRVLADGGSKRALVGHDGRHSGPLLEAAITRGLAQSGFEVVSAGLFPTPGLALIGRRNDFGVTVMISASHNPAEDNGIKIFDAEGEKLVDEVEDRVEAELRGAPQAVTEGPTPPLDAGLEDQYLDALLAAAGDLRLNGSTIVLDCANGAGSRVAPRILGRLGAQVISIASSPDGTNINLDCGSTHPGALQEAVRLNSADIGIALDGDGDRCLLVDERGALVHGDGIMTLLARHAMAQGEWRDPRLVATVMSNRGLHRALREVGVEVVTVGVGDRRVVEALRREGLSLGGEQSGHIIFGSDNDYIGDGIYTALRVLAALHHDGTRLSDAAAPYSPFPQVLLNVPVARKPDLREVEAVITIVREIESALGEDGRVLLRYSGTEPLARVMVEGPDDRWIREKAQGLASVIAREIGS